MMIVLCLVVDEQGIHPCPCVCKMEVIFRRIIVGSFDRSGSRFRLLGNVWQVVLSLQDEYWGSGGAYVGGIILWGR